MRLFQARMTTLHTFWTEPAQWLAFCPTRGHAAPLRPPHPATRARRPSSMEAERCPQHRPRTPPPRSRPSAAPGCPRRCRPSSCTAPRTTSWRRSPCRGPGPGEALVKVEGVGICASDLKCYHGAPKFWGDENRPAWAETEVIPGHEFVGTIVQLDDEAAQRWGVARGRPRGRRADRAVLEVPLLPRRQVLDVPAARHVRLQAPHPGRDGGVHAVLQGRPGAQGLGRPAARARRLRRAAVLRAARRRARRHPLRRRRRGRRLRPDRAGHDRRREVQEPQAGHRPRHGAGQAGPRARVRRRPRDQHRPARTRSPGSRS